MENNILEEKVGEISQKIKKIKQEVHKKIVAQDDLIDSLLIGLFGQGHILVEGVPGLAKTLSVDTLSKTLDLDFNRIQFTPDLLPSDLIGTEIYNVKTGEFLVKKGPIFSNFVLADEINRAPSKVQSALLEAMAERQVTIGKDTFKLEKPFIVIATQNPIEQSGTYNLPEAQLDRFMLKVNVDYASKDIEKEMYKKINDNFEDIKIEKIFSKQNIFEVWDVLKEIYVSDNIFEYVSNIIDATRNPGDYSMKHLEKYISYGISPRGGISLIAGAKVLALMNNRTFVIPEDIKALAQKTLAHRLVLTYEAQAEEINGNKIIEEIISGIKVI